VLEGLHGGRGALRPYLDPALAEGGAVRAGAVGAARARVLDAYEEGPFQPERLGPWLGFLGPQAEDLVRPDPREEALFVTRFEALERCPWQSVLRRLLNLETAPDPLDALPGVDLRLVGNVVHAALEAVAAAALPKVED
jgi:hypothetical protein